jgi:hypothetical protein
VLVIVFSGNHRVLSHICKHSEDANEDGDEKNLVKEERKKTCLDQRSCGIEEEFAGYCNNDLSGPHSSGRRKEERERVKKQQKRKEKKTSNLLAIFEVLGIRLICDEHFSGQKSRSGSDADSGRG